MINILLCGANGNMGKNVSEIVSEKDDFQITCGVDKNTDMFSNYPVFLTFSDVVDKCDVILDFSTPALIDDMLSFAKKNKLPVVICTTGYSDEQTEKIREAAKEIPIFFSYNMSLGISLLKDLAKKAATVLGDGFDVEIIEKHHNQKIDAPSGTAIMLADEINGVFDNSYSYEFDRHSKRQKRDKNEIGIHSVRGGTIVGEHEILFAGKDEIIALSHSAFSKKVFAVGAINAIKFIKDKPNGLYSMDDLLK